MTILTLDQIAKADDLPTKTVFVPQWDGSVVIRALTKQQQMDIYAASEVNGLADEALTQLNLLVESIVEPSLSRDNIGLLQSKSADALDVILGEIFILGAMDQEAVARKRMEFQDESGVVDGVLLGEDVENVSETVAE